jgi:hypothetical protein
MRQLKQLIVLLTTLLVVGCGVGSWTQQFKENPIEVTNRVLQSVDAVVDIAKTLFGQTKPYLPAEKVPELEAEFDSLILLVEDAKSTVSTALEAAAAAGQEKPNLIQAYSKALETAKKVQDFITKVKAASSRLGVGPSEGDNLLENRVKELEEFTKSS